MAAALWIAKRAEPGARFVVLPAAWVVFDWLRSLGFLGYPWGMIGTSQYATPLVDRRPPRSAACGWSASSSCW